MARALALISLLLATAGCADTDTFGSGGSDNSSGSSAGGNNTGGNGVGGNNTGGNGAGGNNTGGNGAGGSGGTAPDFGPPANDLVSAGTVSTNAKYRLVWTMGQSTINQGQSNSTSYRLQGGLIGANGSAQ